jgi:hypothetical protein|tara:strand:+ start:390 stop:587 length:198 start_codon:yes stop_codon:yes gene_type:complete
VSSISEFERTKPIKTFAEFKKVLKKYQKLSEVYPDMDAQDVGIQRTATMVVADLEELLALFQRGE